MSNLPYPPEPSRETIKRHGKRYAEGVADFWEIESTNEQSVAKQGMIEYLYGYWKQQNISRIEVAKACGAANTPIEQWYDGQIGWDDVLKRVKSALDVTLE